jgi:hypothetical protein
VKATPSIGVLPLNRHGGNWLGFILVLHHD